MKRLMSMRRNRMVLVGLVIVAIVLVFILGSLSIPTSAKEIGPKVQRNYTSIEIQSGDSLWSIAENYADTLNMNVRDYIDEVKEMNGLKSDKLVSGTYLIVVYGSIAAEN